MKKILCFLFLPLMLCGCSLNMSIDTLLTPPKLSEQQQQIYNALKSYTGANISLKYPKSGNYLSAFIIDDIDGDSDNEAIVFYEKNTMSAEKNSLRINVLDQDEAGWKSVYDHAADGAELEKIVITTLGENERSSIIVGYSLINQSEKVVSIYDYVDGKLRTTFENNYYSMFEATDFNGDGKNELFMALGQNASREAAASIYTPNSEGVYVRSYVKLSESFNDYQKASACLLENGEYGIYLDASTSGGSIITAVLSVDENNVLKAVFLPDEEKQETLRPQGYTCRDADGDGKLEIPVPRIALGYDEDDTNAMYITQFMGVTENGLEEKYEGYVSISGGYVFILPENWENTTVVNRSLGEISFCRFDGEINEASSDIFSLRTVQDRNSAESLLNSGDYSLLHARGDNYFLIRINEKDSLIHSPAEFMFRFRFYV